MRIWKPSSRRQHLSCTAFPALSRDIFQSFYSLFPKRTDTDSLTAEAQKFNAKLLDHVTEDADYPTIKSICEGRELPAYEAASEFTARISAQLDDLLPELGGKDGTLKTLEKLQAARNQAQQKLAELLSKCGILRRILRWSRR